MQSFVVPDADGHFPIENLPYGVVSFLGGTPRVAVAIGDSVLDLAYLEEAGLLKTPSHVFNAPSLSEFAKLGRKVWIEVREQLQELLSEGKKSLKDGSHRAKALKSRTDVKMHLPFEITGFTDFYASQVHATNVGTMFRGAENALMPNWKHVPIAYNGRSSSVVVDGTPVVWPSGQVKPAGDAPPVFQKSNKMDYEAEIGFFVGKDSEMGHPIELADAGDYLFGAVLVNDWSARDIQAWEYQPLGPFLGKSFATTISSWVVSFEALKPFRIPYPVRTPQPLPYLQGAQSLYDIRMTAELSANRTQKFDLLTDTNSSCLYWTFEQMLTHHASNGCPMKVGDLLASGTVSDVSQKSWGCLLELTKNGKEPLKLSSGEERAFLKPGDTVRLSGHCQNSNLKIGFGSCTGALVDLD